jgi:hypothetical protein
MWSTVISQATSTTFCGHRGITVMGNGVDGFAREVHIPSGRLD